MKRVWLFVLGLACGTLGMAAPRIAVHMRRVFHGQRSGPTGSEQRVHTEEKFAFTAKGRMEVVAPLFGAEKERVWSPGWNPRFIHPLPAADEQGMVFTVAHDQLTAAWVNTEFDLKSGSIQYVYVIPDALVTVITLRLLPQGDQTRVEVGYDRTALRAKADAHVRHMAEGDRRAGPEWEQQVNDYLQNVGSH